MMTNRRLLWIDPETSIDDPMIGVLASEGVLVENAASGATGLALAREGRYTAIFLEMRLPDMHGLRVL